MIEINKNTDMKTKKLQLVKVPTMIEGLKLKIRDCNGGLDDISWGYQEGILISKRDAQTIVELLSAISS